MFKKNLYPLVSGSQILLCIRITGVLVKTQISRLPTLEILIQWV